MTIRKGILFVVAALAVAACDTSTGPALEDRPPALFEIEYMNYAWLPTWKGFYIDASGRLYSYDRRETSDSPPPSRDEYTHAELMQKFDVNRRLIRTIATDSVQDVAELIPDAAAGSLSEIINACADAGALRFMAYIYNANAGRFEVVQIRMEGDQTQENESEAAQTIYEWLNELGVVAQNRLCQP